LTAFKKFKFLKFLNWEILKFLFVLWLQPDYYSLLEASERNLKTEKKKKNTTPLNSFTDGLIPSVTGMKSVGEIITDGLTDGRRPSVYQSSVTPISVAKSVANKKNPSTEHRRSYRRIHARQKKSFPREHYRWNKSVCNFNGNYRRHIRR
jgi:hypothetical protein